MSLKIEEVHGAGVRPGQDTLRLIIKATDAALACSLPRQEVIERLRGAAENPEQWEGDLIFSDVARRLADRDGR